MVKKLKIKLITPHKFISHIEFTNIDRIIKVKIGDKLWTIEEAKNDDIKRNRKRDGKQDTHL